MPHFEAERVMELRQIRNRVREIGEKIFTPRIPLGKVQCCVAGMGKGPEAIPKTGWKPFSLMQRWGGLDQTAWFKMTAVIPEEFKGQRVVALLRISDYSHMKGSGPADEGGEALAYVNGAPYQGIDRNHEFMVLTERAKGGEKFEIVLEACASTRFDLTHVFTVADLAVMNQEAWDFYWDGEVYLEVVEMLEGKSEERRRLQRLLMDAVFMVDLQHQDAPEFYSSLVRARRFLHKGLEAFPSQGLGKLTLIGHSHIDTAWLWPLRETRRKVSRTWSTMLRLMEQYPEFVFAASQPELYMFAKENFPALWNGIRKRVKEGRWELCGASWVEEDNNVPSGEALVRQFLYGNRFYEREFGWRSRTAWLPDAFGYPWSLPQILKKCQIETFYTIKLSWSQFTKFPYGYFIWQGVDGTRIPSVMPPLNYNGNPLPAECRAQRVDFQQKELVDEMPFTFGWGDGGGGPTPKMIEYGKRLKNITGVPRCEFGRTEDCLARMHAGLAGKPPVYNGELYLELHRGCQTTQGRTKRNNRKCEFLLQNAELLSSLAMLHGGRYDQRSFLDAWRILLTHQFHDILPGSSITEVYKDADKNYAIIRALANGVIEGAVNTITKSLDMSGPGTPVLVVNPLSWMRTDVAQVKMKLPRGAVHVLASDGTIAPSQRTALDTLLFETVAVPPLGYAVYHVVAGAAQSSPAGMLRVSSKSIENDYLRIKLDDSGCFVSVYDKFEEREVLAPGKKGNVLQLFDDRPAANDAWDIDPNFDLKMWEPGKAESVEVLEEGPVRAVVRVVRRTEKSVFTQDIVLYALLPRVDVITHVDWHEKHTLLKAAFPVDVLSPRAAYHIQFATVERATHDNRDFDRGRFEVAAHHWADLSEGNYGVSLLNDCKYGYDVKGNTLRLSLLRSPVDPDPTADEGEHVFTYSLFPHGGDWRNGTVQQGFELNQPLLAFPLVSSKGRDTAVYAFASVDAENVIINTVKRAEDSKAIILRVYETYGQRGNATITFANAPKKITECDMMEENDVALKTKGASVTFYMKPYEIKTLKVVF